jgi:hypothetical protein
MAAVTRSLIVLAALQLLPAVSAAQTPHVPTEEQLRQRLGGAKHDADREYQRESVHSFGQSARDAATWVKERLAGLHITPARLMVGLGVLGLLYTSNKNKKKVFWLALLLVSLLLAVFGVAAMIFSWPHMN